MGDADSVIYQNMQRDCPGAAYLLAATVRNTYAVFYKHGREALRTTIAEARLANNETDHSMGAYGLRLMKEVIDAPPLGIQAMVVMVIGKSRADYRELTPSDHETPKSTKLAAAIFPKSCVADAISEFNGEDRHTMLALFDLTLEADTGKVASYARQLDSMIPRLNAHRRWASRSTASPTSMVWA